MFRRMVYGAKRWVDRVVLRRSPVQRWSQFEIERRIRKLEREKQEFKEEMTETKQAYDAKIEEAKSADETEVPDLKSEASRLLSKYEAKRSQWMEVLVGLRFMQQAALGKQISASGPEALPSNMNQAQFERAAERIRSKVKSREGRLEDWGIAATQIEDISQGGSTHMEAMADERVDAAISAAREGEDVPTLDQLADDTFEGTEDNTAEREHEPRATEEPERF